MNFHEALPVGGLLAGDYRIKGVLGQGGFGLTYRAEDTRLGSPVAIKEYFPSDVALREQGVTVRAKSGNEESVFAWGRAKFLDEAKTLAKFRHPNIVRVARLFEANNTAYMVLDFERGPSLSQWRHALGRAPTQEELDAISAALLGAVEAVHNAGILHRDIKPQNVIMRGGTDPVLIDFGAARQALGGRSKTVHAIVTPGYSPMEQYAVDVDKQGAWTDIYALGATLAFLVAGKPPQDALSRSLQAGDDMMREARSLYRPSYLAAIDAAMQIHAKERPQTIADWRAMLFADGGPSDSYRTLNPVGGGSGGGAAPTQIGQRSARITATGAQSPSTSPPQAAGTSSGGFGAALAAPAASGINRNIMIAAVAAATVLLGGLLLFVNRSGPTSTDDAAWQVAVSQNTPIAYDSYLRTFPRGKFANEARVRIATLPGTPPASPPTQPASAPLQPQQQASQSPPTSAPSPAPAPAPNQRATLPVRPTLPAALSPADLARLQSQVTPVDFRLGRSVFANDDARGFSEQVNDFAGELERISNAKVRFIVQSREEFTRFGEPLRETSVQGDLAIWHSPVVEARRHIAHSVHAGSMAFGLAPADHVRWIRADGARSMEELYQREANVRTIPCGIGLPAGFWSRRELQTPTDIAGLRVWAVTGSHEAFRAHGGTTPRLSNEQISQALARNELDVLVQAAPTQRPLRANPPALPHFYQGTALYSAYMMDLVIPGQKWLEIGEPAQRLIDEACRRNLDRWVTQSRSTSAAVIAEIRVQPGMNTRVLPTPLLEAFRTATTRFYEEQSTRDPVFREIYASYNRFRR